MKKIKYKIFAGMISITLMITIFVGIYQIVGIYQSYDSHLLEYENQLFDAYDELIHKQIEAGVSLVTYYYNLYESGELTETEAKQSAINAIKAIRYDESGYIWIDDTQGILVAHPIIPDQEGNDRINIVDPNDTKLIQNIINVVKSDDLSGYTEYMWTKPNEAEDELFKKRAYSELFEEWNWILSTGNYVDDIEDEVQGKKDYYQTKKSREISIVISAMIIALMIASVLASRISRTISRPINKIVKGIEKDEKGKIRIKNVDIQSKDEVGLLSNTINDLLSQLRNFVDKTNFATQELLISSNKMTDISLQFKNSSEEISKSVEDIAISASVQASTTEEGSEEALNLGKVIESNQLYIEKLNQSTQKVSFVVDEGLTEIERLTTISDQSRAATNEVQEGIIRTNESAVKISQASTVIASIAEQTNLLALNAAIEAARAGELGKGFAVVADEIRKLAEESTTSTNVIDTIVKELQTNSKSSVEIMDKVSLILKEQEESIRVSKDKYILIAKAIKDAETSAKNLNASSEETNKMKSTIISTFENLSAIAEENSASTQESSAAMQQQMISFEQIEEASIGLSGLAKNLESIIKKFQV